jgi:hypothetical protein
MLREFFPAALAAFDDLAAPEVLELLDRAPDPASAARLSTAQITVVRKRARRREVAAKATAIQAGLRSRQLGQPPVVAGAYAAPGCWPSSATTPPATPTREHARTTPAHPRSPASPTRRRPRARYVHNDRLLDALNRQAFAALRASPGARAYYDQLRARGVGHHAALRQLGNRLVGILHGCLTSGTVYDETTAWAHHQQDLQTPA